MKNQDSNFERKSFAIVTSPRPTIDARALGLRRLINLDDFTHIHLKTYHSILISNGEKDLWVYNIDNAPGLYNAIIDAIHLRHRTFVVSKKYAMKEEQYKVRESLSDAIVLGARRNGITVSDIQNSLKECVGLSKGEWNILSNGKLPTRFKKNKKANDCLAYALYNLLGTPLTYKLGKKYWNTLIKSQLNA